MNKNTVGVM